MTDSAKISAKTLLGEINAELFPSTFLQIMIPLIFIGVIGWASKQLIIVYIILGIVFIFSLLGIVVRQLRWIFYIGKLSRDIMIDGTAGSLGKPLPNIEEGVLAETDQLSNTTKKRKQLLGK